MGSERKMRRCKRRGRREEGGGGESAQGSLRKKEEAKPVNGWGTREHNVHAAKEEGKVGGEGIRNDVNKTSWSSSCTGWLKATSMLVLITRATTQH